MADFVGYHPQPTNLLVGVAAEKIYGADAHEYFKDGQHVCIGMGVCAAADRADEAKVLWVHQVETRTRRNKAAKEAQQRFYKKQEEKQERDRLKYSVAARQPAKPSTTKSEPQKVQEEAFEIRPRMFLGRRKPYERDQGIRPFSMGIQDPLSSICGYSLPEHVIRSIQIHDLHAEAAEWLM